MRIGLVTGTVGVGKSTIGFAVAERASEAGITAAFLDLDELSRLWPAPKNDPFRDELILTNLCAVAPNYEAAGASLLVLAWAIDGAEDLVGPEKALNSLVKTVRLVSSPTVSRCGYGIDVKARQAMRWRGISSALQYWLRSRTISSSRRSTPPTPSTGSTKRCSRSSLLRPQAKSSDAIRFPDTASTPAG